MAGRVSRPQRGAAPAIRYLHHILGSHSYRSWSGPRLLRSKQWWLFLGLELTADNPTTRACRDVEPCIRLPIALGGTSTRRIRRLAVVLACLGNPITLLGCKLGLGSGTALRIDHQRHAEDSSHSGRHEKLGLLHWSLPFSMTAKS